MPRYVFGGDRASPRTQKHATMSLEEDFPRSRRVLSSSVALERLVDTNPRRYTIRLICLQ